jgi:hypothetical protein
MAASSSLLRVAMLCTALALAAPVYSADLARSPASDTPDAGVLRASLPIQQNDGAPIARVFYDLLGTAGDAARDREVREAIASLVDVEAGDRLNAASLASTLGRVRVVDGVREAAVSLYASSSPGEVVLVISAVLEAPDDAGASRVVELPVLADTGRSLLQLQLATGHGVFADHNPWFGAPATFTAQSPIASAPPGRGWTSWAESSVEYGLAGATRLGNAPATAFAELTAVGSAAVGNDLFRDGPRYRNKVEKAYGGVAWTDRANGRSLKVSAGRQNWQLYGGFLFSRFAAGANAGPNPGLYLSPRTTYQRTVLLDARAGLWRFEAFDLDPAELDQFDSGSRYVGANLRRVDPQGLEWGLTGYRVPESRSRVPLATGGSAPREGLRVWAARLGRKSLFGVQGLDILGEYASQDSTTFDWDAKAWYAQIGYGFRDVRWSPHLTYRRATFSGDDPATSAQEAFDAQLSSGLDEWVQGIGFKKVVTNSNLETHRIRLNLGDGPALNFTFDLFRLDADRRVPGGFQHYGDEFNAAIRWAISPQLYFLGVVGQAWPGDEIRRRTDGAARPWSTFQASLFWGL